MALRAVFDPGHGGKDPGACGCGLYEKNVVLPITLRAGNTLKNCYQGVDVLFTRTDDRTLSLKQRCDIANNWKADVFISCHVDAFYGRGTGMSSFVLPSAYQSTRTARNIIHDEVYRYIRTLGLPNRGYKYANFYVLRETDMSAALFEFAFIDNPRDASFLKQNIVLDRIGDAVARGVAKAYGLQSKPQPKPAPIPVEGKLLRVQTGAYRVEKNAIHQADALKKAGFPVYIAKENGLYKVQVGAYRKRPNADSMAERLKSAGFPVFITEA